MEDNCLIAKTLLECYAHLDELYEALTKRAEAIIASGFYAIYPSEQMRLYERIIETENRKIALYNMKYVIESVFHKGSSLPLSLLKERYLNSLSKEEIMIKYGVCLRTYYRYLKKGICDFTHQLERMGFDKKRLLCEFGNESLFQCNLTKVIREDDADRSAEQEKERVREINNRHTHLHRGNIGHGCCCV